MTIGAGACAKQYDTVQRSRLGVNKGACFLSFKSDATTDTIKETPPHLSQFVAATFLRQAGLATPRMRLVPVNSGEGAKIRQAVHRQYPPPVPGAAVQLAFKPLGYTQPSHYIVMGYLQGCLPLDGIQDNDNREAVIRNLYQPETLQTLGRLTVYDLIMGNKDRFNLKDNNANTGNLMIHAVTGQLRPIDQIFAPTHEREPDWDRFATRVMGKIGSGDMSYAEKLLRLMETYATGEVATPAERESAIGHLHHGMHAGVANFCSPSFEAAAGLAQQALHQEGVSIASLPDVSNLRAAVTGRLPAMLVQDTIHLEAAPPAQMQEATSKSRRASITDRPAIMSHAADLLASGYIDADRIATHLLAAASVPSPAMDALNAMQHDPALADAEGRKTRWQWRVHVIEELRSGAQSCVRAPVRSPDADTQAA